MAHRHNISIVSQLESEIRAAAEIGQHLLKKHDAYIEATRKEQDVLVAEIERQSAFGLLVDELELQNRDLEDQNRRTMDENMALIKRLEDLNSSLIGADWHNNELRSELQQAEHSAGVLSHRASKTRDLEARICTIETEKEQLEIDLAGATRHNRANELKHKRASEQVQVLERKLAEMNIELELQRLRDSEDFARTMDHIENGNGERAAKLTKIMPAKDFGLIITELLSQNSLLQNDTLDLRSLLADSQEEIISLRQQLRKPSLGQISGLGRTRTSTDEEHREPRKVTSQELHQHHHYHYHTKPEKRPKPKNVLAATRRATRSNSSLSSQQAPVEKAGATTAVDVQQLELVTPVQSKLSHLIDKSPRSNYTDRDSGYFSIVSSSSRGRPTHSHPPKTQNLSSHLLDFENHDIYCSTPIRKSAHNRSNSHESVFLRPETSTAENTVPLQDELSHARESPMNAEQKQLESALSCGTAKYQGIRTLRRSASQESFIMPTPSYNARELLPAMRLRSRPFASPLQNATSLATVSITSETVHTTKVTEVRNPSRTGNVSYNSLLRNAAAAQKQASPSTTSTPSFWKKSSTAEKPLNPLDTKSKWTFPKWTSNSTSDQVKEDLGPSATVTVSGVDQDLLREALGNF